MSYTVLYQKRAVQEYEETIAWYLQRSENAALNFELVLKEKVDMLRADPFCGTNTYKNFHEVSLKKYPYRLVYLIDLKAKRVVISSIFHTKRNPHSKFSV